MSKRFDNKQLLILLAGLIVILLFTTIIKIPKERATLKDKIVVFDSTEVSKIVLYPKTSIDKPVEFTKSNGKWKVQQGIIVSDTRKNEVENILMEILSTKPQNLVTKNKAKWIEYEVSDSTGTRIKLLTVKGKTLTDLVIGRFSYKQLNNQYSMYGRNNIQGTSYIRLTGEDEVYGVDGFLSLSFNRTFSDWRENRLIECSREDITSISFAYPSDSSFKLTRKESKWYIANTEADSTGTSGFLNSLTNIEGQEFNDTFRPDVNPDYQLLIEGNNLLNISVKCYQMPDGTFALNSSLNPDIYFSSKRDGVFGRLFKPREFFISGH